MTIPTLHRRRNRLWRLMVVALAMVLASTGAAMASPGLAEVDPGPMREINKRVIEAFQASSDGQTWTTVLTESQEIRDGSNKSDRTIDIAPYLGADKTIYNRVADSFPADGWGGRVTHVNATLS